MVQFDACRGSSVEMVLNLDMLIIACIDVYLLIYFEYQLISNANAACYSTLTQSQLC